ncbi:MAG: alpha/beta fold hydrolase [Burkholderiales bacterium]|nr:alpha/beta fold hydrolase [Burkholderiales bacterium]MDE2277611.1 alpha/beta fold hydrolase [Burkholderiales bacterium]
MPGFEARYAAPRWLPGGNLQTIWAATRSRHHLGTPPPLVRERWTTPDGDFIDVDHLQRPAGAAPAGQHLVLFHGLEGSSASQYAQAFAVVAQARGWAYSVPHFRGCSGEINLAPRAYHSGDFEEIGWILQRLRVRSAAPLRVVGVSLGGNALLRWAEEMGASAAATAAAVAAVCSPVDLAAAGHAIDRGFNWLVYSRMFLATMKPRALARLERHPGLFDRARLVAARTLFEFDNVFTAPLHGFRDTPDYWARASALPHLAQIRIPALLLHARNDPFVPAASLPGAAQVGRHVTLWRPAQGGHVGFPHPPWPSHTLAMPTAVADWLQDAA